MFSCFYVGLPPASVTDDFTFQQDGNYSHSAEKYMLEFHNMQ